VSSAGASDDPEPVQERTSAETPEQHDDDAGTAQHP
jgi:hypothetical protein